MDNNHPEFRAQAQAIANKAEAIANGTAQAPIHAHVQQLRELVNTLAAWVEDDR